MPSKRVLKSDNHGTYFLTFTVKGWLSVLDKFDRWNILADSLKFCQKNKGLKIFGFVFMTDHIHLIISSSDVFGFIRDFKSFTSKQMHKNIQQTELDMINFFIDEDGQFSFWLKTNMPKLIENEKFFLQKLNYIQENPLRKNYVKNVEDWYWSSANRNCEIIIDSAY